jgi:hypothetical protein
VEPLVFQVSLGYRGNRVFKGVKETKVTKGFRAAKEPAALASLA